MKKLIFLALTLLSSACSTPADEGRDFGKSISFTGANPKLRTSVNTFPDRMTLRTQLTNNSVVWYTKFDTGTFPVGYTDQDGIRVDLDSAFYREKGILFSADKVKSHGPFLYFAASSQNFNCFLYVTSFDRRGEGYGRKIGSSMCYGVTFRSAEDLQAEMFDFMDRMLVDGHPIVRD